MVVHEEEPFNAETGLAALGEGPLTATDAFYVRGHATVPEIDPGGAGGAAGWAGGTGTAPATGGGRAGGLGRARALRGAGHVGFAGPDLCSGAGPGPRGGGSLFLAKACSPSGRHALAMNGEPLP